MSFFPRDLAAPVAAPHLAISWEEPDCLLCGRHHWTPVIEAQDHMAGDNGLWFAVVQCQECGLCFTNPRPDVNTIGQFYPPWYGPHQPAERRPSGGWLSRWPAAWHLPGKPSRVLSWPGPGRLLDFGCGRGAFLERMQRQGWHVTGVDIAARALQSVPPELESSVLLGTLPHPELRPGTFDVITMWHSLEHVHDPLAVLREARRLLAARGKLVIAVPNIGSLPFRWFAGAWLGLDLPRHLTHFTPRTLHKMLQRAGFKVGPIRMVRHSHWLRASAGLSVRNPAAPAWHRWLKIKTLSRMLTWYGYFTGQTDSLMVTAARAR